MLKILTINAITQYIDDNLEKESINIDKLVNYSGYSKRYLQLLFKSKIGISVGKYIQLRRITRAATLLRFTNLSISNVSARLLYDSQQTFTREFKKNSGYTPLQYRKSKVWAFENMTGRREANSYIPTPEIRYLEQKKIFGKKIFYKEKIPATDPLSELKWISVDYLLAKSNDSVYISHKFELDKIDNNYMYFNAVLWGVNEDSKYNGEELNEGFYAYFHFNGSRDEYRKLIYNIYLNVLPFYGLQKKDSYDLEIITKTYDDACFFEYFLPIEKEE
ncbi:helix-turn-helix domain-containing protein [Escherichia coli O54:H45]